MAAVVVMRALLFALLAQDLAGSRIYVMDLLEYRTAHRLIGVVVFRGIFCGKTLNAVSSFGAPIHEEWHVEITRTRCSSGRDLNPS
jgi:hypothetical protein